LRKLKQYCSTFQFHADPDPHQSDKLDPAPAPHQSDKLNPDPDPQQFADDKQKCMEYKPI
jgi:hypothetical protein